MNAPLPATDERALKAVSGWLGWGLEFEYAGWDVEGTGALGRGAKGRGWLVYVEIVWAFVGSVEILNCCSVETRDVRVEKRTNANDEAVRI